MPETTSVFTGIELTERGQRALDRVKEIFKIDSLPAGLEVLAGSENGINDLYMNLNRQVGDGKWPRKSKLLVAVGVSSALGSAPATEFFAKAAVSEGRTPQEVLEAVSVATICSAFNGYYRFRYQVPADMKETFTAYKAAFNANTFLRPSIAKEEMEAICIAVSSANDCLGCVEGHISAGKNAGLTDDQIDEIIRTGAIAGAMAATVQALTPA